MQIWITVANVGDSKAIVKSVDGRVGRRYFSYVQTVPIETWIGPDPKDTPNIYIPAQEYLVSGQRARYLIPDDYNALSAQDIAALQIRTHHLCLLGEIVYTDAGGIERRTGFFRVYDPGANTFVRPYETDTHYEYEYAD